MKLFSDFVRTDFSPIGMRETPFKYYDRIAGEDGDRARDQLEAFVSELDPAQSRRVIEALKKVKSLNQFQEAFWELYLHHAFARQGFTVEFEPQIFQPGNIDAQTPDMRVSKDGRSFYVEATVINEPGNEDKERDVRRLVQEEVDKRLKSSDFYLTWQVLKQGSANQIRVTNLVNQLRIWLGGLDVQSVEEKFNRFQHLPEFVYKQGPWKIHFEANPLPPEQRGAPFDRIIGVSREKFGIAEAQRDYNDIRDAIKQKGKKYPSLDAPLIIAVMVLRLGAGNLDIRAALFGGASIPETLLAGGHISGGGRGIDIDGVWATRKGPAYQHVSAVITIDRNLEPAGQPAVEPTVWLNPWGDASVKQVFNWPTMVADTSTGILSK